MRVIKGIAIFDQGRIYQVYIPDLTRRICKIGVALFTQVDYIANKEQSDPGSFRLLL